MARARTPRAAYVEEWVDPLEEARTRPQRVKHLRLGPWSWGPRGKTPILAFPPEILGCTNLESLQLRGAIAEQGDPTIPEELGKLRSLRTLDLSHLALCDLPESIGKLRSLRDLALEETPKLRALPRSIGRLTACRRLAINFTPALKELPREIGGMKHLETLHMAYSGIRTLPKELWDCTNLRSLVVPDEIEELPPGIRKLTKLEQLVCHPNALRSVARELPKLVSLQNIALSVRGRNAPLIRLPEELGKVPKLSDLLFGYSRTVLPASLEGHPELRVLDLSGTHMKTIAQLALSWRKLENLELEDSAVPKEERAVIDHFMAFPPHRRIELLWWERRREEREEEKARLKAEREKQKAEHEKAKAAAAKAKTSKRRG